MRLPSVKLQLRLVLPRISTNNTQNFLIQEFPTVPQAKNALHFVPLVPGGSGSSGSGRSGSGSSGSGSSGSGSSGSGSSGVPAMEAT